MGFDSAVSSVGTQVQLVSQAWIPFAIMFAFLAVCIWRVLEWSYGSTIKNRNEEIARLKAELQLKESATGKSHAQAATPQRAVTVYSGGDAIARHAALASWGNAVARARQITPYTRKSSNELDRAVTTMRAAMLSMKKSFGIDTVPHQDNPWKELQLSCLMAEKVRPYLAANHIEEGRQAALDFLAGIELP